MYKITIVNLSTGDVAVDENTNCIVGAYSICDSRGTVQLAFSEKCKEGAVIEVLFAAKESIQTVVKEISRR